MKINELKINDYGCIKDTDIVFNKGITIIKGNNESGKSTTHQAILASLFGFRNTKNTKTFALSPKVKSSWGDYPKLSAKCMDINGNFETARYFMDKAPKLDIKRNGSVTKYQNESLEAINNISRDTYEGIYSLDIDQIARLKENWEREQTSILGGLYPDFLLNYKQIQDSLDKQIKQVWRGKNQSKIQKSIDDNIKDLRRQLQQAKENQSYLHQLEIDEERQKHDLEDYNKQIIDIEKKLKDAERTQDFYTEIDRLNELSLDIIDLEKYEELPNDLSLYFAEKQKDVDKKRDRINTLIEEYEKLKQKKNMFSLDHKRLCKNKSEIDKAENIASQINRRHENISHIENKSDRAQIDFNEIASRTFTNDYSEKHIEHIKNIDIAECMSIYNSIVRIQREKAANNNTIIKMSKININNIKNVLYILAIFLGQAMIFFSKDNMLAKIFGALISIGVLALMFIQRPKKNTVSEYKKKNEELEDNYRKGLSKLQSLLRFSFLPMESQENPDEHLINSLRMAQIHLSEIDRCNAEIKEERTEIEAMENEINSVAKSVLGHSNSYQQDVFEMVNRLKEAQVKQDDARDAEMTENSLSEQIQTLDKEIDELNEQLEKYKNTLKGLSGENDTQRMTLLKDMRQKKIEIDSSNKRLKAKYSDYDLLLAQAKDNVHAVVAGLNEYIDNQLAKLNDIKETQSQLLKESGETKQKLNDLKNSNLHPAIVEGKLQDALDDRASRIKERDTLAVTQAIIKKSKDLFVREYKPEFLDLASRYLVDITDGRYKRILLSESGSSIMVESKDNAVLDFDAIEGTVSRGTKEQIFLSLRLAMLNRFDPQGDPLPVILDEALVNWDSNRFTRLMKILSDIANERQVFMFTCHNFMIENAERANITYTKVDI